MASLPNAANAVVDRSKLVDYVLDPSHPVGKHKARVFQSALGVDASDAEFLEAALIAAVQGENGTIERQDAYGVHYSVEFVLEVRGRSGQVRSLWTVRVGEDFPRFVSAFLK